MRYQFKTRRWFIIAPILMGGVFLITLFNPWSVREAQGVSSYDGNFGMLLNFENNVVGQYNPNHLWYWQWGADSLTWRDFSTLDIVQGSNNKYLRFWVKDSIPDAISSFKAPNSLSNLSSVQSIVTIGSYVGNLLSPRADAVKVKLKIEQGSLGLTFGSSVSQLGNSDVLTKVKYLSTSNHDDCVALADGWIQCEFDLNANLIRNLRRSNYSGDNTGVSGSIKNLNGDEIIYYNRWVQETMSLYLVNYNSNGVKIISGNPIVLIDDIELINKGQGKTFPTFSTITNINTIADFETNINNVFKVNFNWPTSPQPPTSLSLSSIANSGTKSLTIVSNTAEELSWTAINAPDGEAANAVSFEMRVDYSNNNFTQHAIDFIALATPTGNVFPWTGLTGSNGFDYQLSEASTANTDFAVYSARRIIPEDTWVTVTIPFVDFVAAYGSGSMINHHREQKSLRAGEISVVGLQTSWRQYLATTSIYIDSIRYVNVPGSTSDLRSYYQAYADSACVESWSCGTWSACSNNTQTRSCIDANVCGTTNSRPPLSQSCTITPNPTPTPTPTPNPTCLEYWTCTTWSVCSNDQKTRVCNDANACGTTYNRPTLNQSCSLTSPPEPDLVPVIIATSTAGILVPLDDTPYNFAIGGRLVKTATDSAVYYLANNTRYLFVNQVTFFSWRHGAWNDNPVEVISQSIFDSLLVGQNIIVRPGTKLLRFAGSSIVYAVKPGGHLCQAEANYGENWRDRLVVIQNGFETNYTKDANCKITASTKLPDGTLLKYQGSTVVWYIDKGLKRSITTTVMAKYGFRSDAVVINVPITMVYPVGPIIE